MPGQGIHEQNQRVGVVSNFVDEGGGELCQSFWYDLFPSMLYVMIGAYRPQDAEWANDVREIADTWLHVAKKLNGDWEHIGYSLKKDAAVDPRSGMESDAAIGVAYILLAAYQRFGDEEYLRTARSLTVWAAELDYNPNYEILGSYGPYMLPAFRPKPEKSVVLTDCCSMCLPHIRYA